MTDKVKLRRFADVAILFCDVVGFTPYCEDNSRLELVVEALGRLVDRFEEIAQKRGLEKLKTVGDAFIATAGLLRAVDSLMLARVKAGHDMVAAAATLDARPGRCVSVSASRWWPASWAANASNSTCGAMRSTRRPASPRSASPAP